MSNFKFSKSHEWALLDGEFATIGISDYAQHSLGDIVFVDLPSVGATYQANDEFGAIESVKAASELLMPISGTVVAINEQLFDAPNLINEAPLTTWLIRIKVSDASEVNQLLDEAEYTAQLK